MALCGHMGHPLLRNLLVTWFVLGFPEAGVPSEMRTPVKVIYEEVFPGKMGMEVRLGREGSLQVGSHRGWLWLSPIEESLETVWVTPGKGAVKVSSCQDRNFQVLLLQIRCTGKADSRGWGWGFLPTKGHRCWLLGVKVTGMVVHGRGSDNACCVTLDKFPTLFKAQTTLLMAWYVLLLLAHFLSRFQIATRFSFTLWPNFSL